jgi:chloramphenicol O-acetyltransferase type A
MIKRYIDVATWNRKEHFEFYKNFNEGFYGFTSNVICTEAYEYCKINGKSFYLYYLHKILKVVNEIDHLKMRIEGEKVVLFDTINCGPTVGREDNTFGFSFIEYFELFDQFEEKAKVEIERVKSTSGLCFSNSSGRLDSIHFSAVPWINFTSVSHARMIGSEDNVPKISVGKLSNDNGKYSMPVSIHVHHALVDGYHVGLFFEKLEKELNGIVS